ncbi:MAG: RnfABCDGE type electron transport complex subunit D [Candidatus Omnitrophica bacterium]|nr:RnfABCDGE type electron transport complex subunit D [Candidatus Omnitrophota bacterium]
MSNLVVSPSPHIRTAESVSRIMWLVSLSLVPAGAVGVYFFGWRALWVIALGVVSAVATEYLLYRLMGRKCAVLDGSAALTGLLVAYNVSASVPLWLPVVGSFVAIAVGKTVFGGLGRNIFNPALVGRAFLMASWPQYMTAFVPPRGYDALTQATPLAALGEGLPVEQVSYLDLFLGARGGCIGEVCILALLAGAVFLLIMGYISWHTPAAFIGSAIVFMYLFGGEAGFASGDMVFHLLTGGLVLGAFFMATDYATSPLSRKGQLVFGTGCGILTGVIRTWGGYPEGVSYAILIMNAFVPLIDRYVRPRIYGT